MRCFRVRTALLASLLFLGATGAPCSAQDFREVSSDIAQRITASGRKRVAVVDFTNLQGQPTPLGRYLAEEFSTSLVERAKNFDVIDRTHITILLKEHKLATTGLIDPATARQLGKIAGVDALVTGTITPFEERIHLSLKVLDVETAKMLAASTLDVPKTKTIADLGASDATGSEATPRAESAAGVTHDQLLFVPRNCEDRGGRLVCSFGVTNNSNVTRNMWLQFDGSLFVVDDQGTRYHPRVMFGPNEYQTDLIPSVTTAITLEVSDLSSSPKSVAISLSFGYRDHKDQYWGNSSYSQVVFRNIAVVRR